MTLLHYFIFLACLLAFNIAVLYTYFLRREEKEFEKIHNETFIASLPKAYPILVLSFLIGAAALFYFSSDKTWFLESKFLYFLGFAVVFAGLGFISVHKKIFKILKALLELAGITGFVFMMPDNELFSKFDLPDYAVRAGMAAIWFVLFEFSLVLNRFEGLIAAQLFHIGFSSLLVFVLISFSFPIAFYSLLQVNGLLCVLIFMLSPFYYVLRYKLPLQGPSLNVLCFSLTGLSFLMVMTGNWGFAALIMIYTLFELTVVCYRFVKNLIFRTKMPLFFFETLSEEGVSNEKIVHLILRYHFIDSGLIFFIVYTNIQLQPVVLATLLYVKMYFYISDPDMAKASFTELYRQVKKDAKKGLTSTGFAISEFKEKHRAKTADKTNKEENAPHDQP